MLRVEDVQSIRADDTGIIIKNEESELFLSWKTIDVIAEASEEHYFGEVLREFAIMNSQKKIN